MSLDISLDPRSGLALSLRPVLVMPIADAAEAPDFPESFAWRPTQDHHARALRHLRKNLDTLANGASGLALGHGHGLTWAQLLYVLYGAEADSVGSAPVSRIAPAEAARLCLDTLLTAASLEVEHA